MALRILITGDFYPPFMGGAERQVQLLAHELTKRGYDVSVATVWHAGLEEVENDQGVQVYRLKGLFTQVPWFSADPRRRFHPPFADPGIVKGLQHILRAFQPDVVHANGWIAHSCSKALETFTMPLLISARDYGYSCATRTMLRGGKICDGPALGKCLACARSAYGTPKALAAVGSVFAGRRFLKHNVDGIHSVSTFVQEVMRRDLLQIASADGQPDVSTIADIVTPGFMEQEEPPLQDYAALKQLPDEPFLLFVGALQPHKGVSTLLAAYERLESPPPLVLIGTVWPDTPDRFPPGVTVLHNVPHAAVLKAWERCVFGIAPSIWPDPLPGVVREAMSKGKTVIGTAVGGIVDMIINNETGLLVPPDDEVALATAMQRLINDPALCDRLGAAGLECATRFTAMAVLPQFEALYQQLVAGATG